MPNRIFRGPSRSYITISAPVAGAYLPGIAVAYDGTNLTAAGNPQGRMLVLLSREFYTQTPEDAYAADETGMGVRVLPEDELLMQLAAGTYTRGAALTVGAGGVLEAAGTGDIVVAFYDQDDATLAAQALADVVIANRYTRP